MRQVNWSWLGERYGIAVSIWHEGRWQQVGHTATPVRVFYGMRDSGQISDVAFDRGKKLVKGLLQKLPLPDPALVAGN
jgi:hypothetical protein